MKVVEEAGLVGWMRLMRMRKRWTEKTACLDIFILVVDAVVHGIS